jgi:hypothetical protein
MFPLLVAFTLITSTFSPAHAIYDPEWNRPLSESTMTVVAEEGFLAGQYESLRVTLTRQDGSGTYGIDLGNGEFQHRFLHVTTVTQDECGATIYRAVAPARGVSRFWGRMELIDHSTSECGRPRRWQLTFESGDSRSHYGRLVLSGVPEPVFTVSSVER